MSTVAKEMLAIPASSAANECSFIEAGGHHFTAQNGTGHRHFRKHLFIQEHELELQLSQG
jgi:hypothetical protein